VQVLGYVFLALLGVAVLIGLGFAVRSLPDLARYLRIRRM
jgi:hypothetical protein